MNKIAPFIAFFIVMGSILFGWWYFGWLQKKAERDEKRWMDQSIKDFFKGDNPYLKYEVQKQLDQDKRLLGLCIYTIGPNGEKIRHDPTKTVIEYL